MGGRDVRNERDRRGWSPRLFWAQPDKLDASNKMVNVPPLEVNFQQGGTYITSDPELQFHLETNASAVGWGKAGRDQWEKIYLSTEQRKAISEAELENVQRQVREQNTLLEQVKAQRASGTTPTGDDDDGDDPVANKPQGRSRGKQQPAHA
jgi:hypothetical protein